MVKSKIFHSLFLFAAIACQARSLDLRGRVLIQGTTTPIAAASIQFIETGLSTTSSTDGRFSLNGSVTSIKAHSITSSSIKSKNNFPLYNFLGRLFSKPNQSNHSQFLNQSTEDFASSKSAQLTVAQPLRKISGSGLIQITKDGYTSRSIPFTSDTSDLGDIFLTASQKIGVGAAMPTGAYMLFDGTQGKAAANAELQSKWIDWPRFTPSAIKFNIAKDPEFLNDTNRVTLQSCCNTLWGYDDIQAKTVHGDAQIHVEFNCMGQYDTNDSANANDSYAESAGPGYSNSGVYVQSRYEIQIYSVSQDPNQKITNHQMGSIVDDTPPNKNMNRPNGKWQSYDIVFREARRDNNGALLDAARISLWWNGTLVIDNYAASGKASGLANHSGEELNAIKYGLKLQSEGRDVRFRNIWVKDLVLVNPLTNILP